MARPRNPKSKISLDGLRLKKPTENALQQYAEDKNLSIAAVKRYAITELLKKEGYV
jgi:hypothetical protein